MAQEADLTETGTNQAEEERNRRSGSDIPGGTGVVGDEDINAIGDANEKSDRQTGQDHSTEDYEKTMPERGVGAVQDHSDTTSDVARIED
jgi:hypothetical protein